MHRSLQRVSELFFPATCLHCAQAVGAGPLRHLCARCADRVELVTDPSCPSCGHPRYHPDEDLCPHCVDFQPHYRCAKVVVMAKGPVRALVHELKYHQGLQVLADVETAARAAPEFLAWLQGAVLVPVPLHPARERHRGYNQSEAIARVFAKLAGPSVDVQTPLRRLVFTQSQTRQDRATRRGALGGVFSLAATTLPRARRHVLVDDVLTTGSTLSHCAAVLVRAGVAEVDACAFGHG